MTRICFVVLSFVAYGCGVESGTVVIGSEQGLRPIELDRTVHGIPVLTASAPPDGTLDLEAQDGQIHQLTLTTDPTDGSRELSLDDEVTVLSAEDAQQVRDSLDGADPRSIRALELRVTRFVLTDLSDPARPRIAPSSLEAMTIQVDGATILTRADLAALHSGKDVQVRISGPTLDRFTAAIAEGTSARARVATRLSIPSASLAAFPSDMRIQLTAQPSVEVSVLSAIATP